MVSLFSLFVGQGVEFLGVVTRRRKLLFNYVLFGHRSGSYGFAGCSSVGAASGQRAQVTYDAIRGHIESHPEHGQNTGHHIQIYQVLRLNLLFGV